MKSWDSAKDEAYRAEVERRYRERTPPRTVDDICDRVSRSEMRNWCLGTFGILPPETDEEWIKSLSLWYKKLVKQVAKEIRTGD